MPIDNIVTQIIAEISKKISKQSWPCLHEDCGEAAINSHFLQKNGILNTLAENGFLYESKLLDPHHWKREGGPIGFKKIGLKQALSLRVFCAQHDNTIFQGIEGAEKALSTYQAFLLLSYRVTCAELRKKKMNADLYKGLLNDDRLEGKIDRRHTERWMNGFILGCMDLYQIKLIFENEIMVSAEKFTFKVIEYDLIEVCASAIFSAPDSYATQNDILGEFQNVYIHLIPRNGKLLITIGYHNDYVTPWISSYLASWEKLDREKLEYKISELFIEHIENWAISERLFNNLKPANLDQYTKLISKDRLEHYEVNFNLFS